ncbi:hypothetical protein C2138_10740 [Salinibacterium hongtaonis]|nr:hypothetical protein C2138_10740 [Salinibacterium hongtaonis]
MAGRRARGHDITMTNDSPAPSQAPNGSNSFFEWMRGLGIIREPGWIGGVAAGLATRLGIDALIVRGIIVALALLGAPALLLYAAAWALLPDTTGRIHLEELFRGTFDKAIAGIGVMLLIALLPFGSTGWWFFPGIDSGWYNGPSLAGIIWAVLLTGAAVWLVIWLARKAPSTPAGPPYSAADSTAPSETPASSASFVAGETMTAAPTAPPAPPAGSGDAELAAWKQQQAEWKRTNDEWRRDQNASAHAKQQQAAAERRRINQEAAAERRRIAEEHDRITRPGATYTLIAIGLALIAGGATALIISSFDWAVESKVVASMSASLAVLAVAIIINGFRGKRSGGSSGVAVLLVIALILTSFFSSVRGPLISDRDIIWQPAAAAHAQERTVIAGDVRLDLSDYSEEFTSNGFDRTIELTVVAGEVTVIAPADVASQVDVDVTFGSITSGRGDNRDFDTDGVGITRVFEFEPRSGSSDDDRLVLVEIHVIAGEVSVSQAR